MDDVVGDRHLADERLDFDDLLAGEHRGDLVGLHAGGAPGDLELFLEARVLHEHLEHEAVLLRFGQRVGAFLFDRVLRRQHEERVGELVADAADRDLPLLHGFEQRGLRSRRRAVDLVGEDHVGEQRARPEQNSKVAGRAGSSR